MSATQHFEWGKIRWVMGPEQLKTPYPMSIGLLSLYRGKAQKRHIHYGEEQILYIVQGQGLQIIENVKKPCKSGDVIYIEAGSAHETINTGDISLVELVISVPSGNMPPSTILRKTEEWMAQMDKSQVLCLTDDICEKYRPTIENLRFPLNLFDGKDALLVESGPYPEICLKRCNISESVKNCHLYSDVHRFTMAKRDPFAAVVCRYGLTVFVYPLELRGQLVGLLQGGHIRTEQNDHVDALVKNMDRVHKGRIQAMLEQIQRLGENLLNEGVAGLLISEIGAHQASLKASLASQDRLETLARESEDRLYSVQLNNHFLFNALNGLASLAVKEKATQTYTGIVDLANMFRYHLRSLEKHVYLEDEIDFLKNYMSLQQIRFGKNVGMEIVCPQGIKKSLVPFNCLQPLVENCFRHGFKDRSRGLKIHIEAVAYEEDLLICVKDDGIGISRAYDQDCVLELYPQGISKNNGLFMINKRLQAQFGDAYTFEIYPSKALEWGTEVHLKMPMIWGGRHEKGADCRR